jgi:hypothetical protein
MLPLSLQDAFVQQAGHGWHEAECSATRQVSPSKSPTLTHLMKALYSLLLVAGAAHLATADQIPAAVADKLGGACKLNAGGCCDFSGEWCNHFNSDGIFKKLYQDTGSCLVYGMLRVASGDHAGSGGYHCTNGTVVGDTLSMFCKGKPPALPDMNRTLTLSLSTPQDIGQWNYPGPNGRAKWYRGGNYGNYTCRTNKTMF